jgi:hypothetical protein
MNIPCKDCITLSVCRYKPYLAMFHDCYLVFDYLQDHNHAAIRDEDRLKLLFKTLKPKYWSIRKITSEELKDHTDIFKDKLLVISKE